MAKDQGQDARPQGTSASQHLRKNRLLRTKPLDCASRKCSSSSALCVAAFTAASVLACSMSQRHSAESRMLYVIFRRRLLAPEQPATSTPAWEPAALARKRFLACRPQ